MGLNKYKSSWVAFFKRFVKHLMETSHLEKKSIHVGLHKIEMIVLGAASLLVFLMVAGWFRRNRRFGILDKFLLLGFIVVPSLIDNIFGRLKKYDSDKEAYYSTYLVTWVTLLLIGNASTDSINAMKVPKNEDYKKFLLQFLVYALLLAWYVLKYLHNMYVLLYFVGMLWGVIILKVEERARAFWYASEAGVANITQVFADYMMYEHTLSKQDEVNPITLKGYKYLVDVRDVGYNMKPPSYWVSIDIRNAVTIDKIWDYQDQDQGHRELLNSKGDPKGKLKDLCLSMSLFWLLLRRFGGYNTLHESKLAQEKTLNFVRQGLLADGAGSSSERVFRVIEIELKFLYDFLYTKHYAGYVGSWQLMKRFCQLAIIVTVSTFYIWLTHFLYQLMIFTVNELVQIIFLLNSQWNKVSLICLYVRRGHTSRRFLGQIIRLLCLVPNRKPWTRRLGQYSLLDNHDFNPRLYRFFRSCLGNLVYIPRVGQKESSNVKLSKEVKEELVSYLRQYDPDLKTNAGISVWARSEVLDNDLVELHKYCKLETQTHVILVWHIATSYCEMSYGGKKHAPKTHKDFKVAKELSMYCAYLVAFAPKLLPVPEKTTTSIFDQVIKEANKLFGRKSCKCCLIISRCVCKGKSKYEKMNEISNEFENTNIGRGVLLGKHLKDTFKNEDQLWNNLAKFWVEMLLFLAPSNDHVSHAEHLAKGGELITHLWVLLTHAGIVQPRQFMPDQTSCVDADIDVDVDLDVEMEIKY